MRIELDWQFIGDDAPQTEALQPSTEQRGRLSRKRLLGWVLMLVLVPQWGGVSLEPGGARLAVTLDPNGVMLVALDMAAMRWLNTPSCKGIAWRPAHCA